MTLPNPDGLIGSFPLFMENSQVPAAVPVSAKLYVGNLSFKIREQEIREAFSQAGEVRSIFLPVERETGRMRGFAFVEMATAEQAEQAIKMFHDQDLAGRKMLVTIARPKEAGSTPRREFRGGREDGYRSGNRLGSDRNSRGGSRSYSF